MKNLLLGILYFTAVTAIAQEPMAVRTSVANGNASMPTTWDCNCFPLPGDVIIINSNVILDVNWAFSTGSLTVNAGKSLTGNTTDRVLAVNGGSFVNNGTTSIAYIYHDGGTFTNNSILNVTQSFGNNGAVTSTNNNTMTISDTLYIAGTFSNYNTISAYATAVTGTFYNSGSFTTGDLWNSGSVSNSGLPGLYMTNNIYSSGTINNYTAIRVDNNFISSENVTNNDYIDIGNSLYTGDSVQFVANFTNNGLVSVAVDMYCNQTVTGTGDFCVGAATVNGGTISGTLDICDLTGGGIDVNGGTVAGTVTFCSSGCAVGVTEEDVKKEINVYPNPFENRLTVNLEGYDEAKIVLQNILGQKVLTQNISGKTEIQVTDLESGVYFYSVMVENKIVSSGKLLKE